MKLLYGTQNPGKLASMRRHLSGLDMELIGLNDLSLPIPQTMESGMTPLENAECKARAYFKAFHIPVFSCDSGLYFENLPPELSPQVHVRTGGGRVPYRMDDEQMITYYSTLAAQYGEIIACFHNAICFIPDEEHIYKSSRPSMNDPKFIITAKPHHKRVKGFPIDSLSKVYETGEYYFDANTSAETYLPDLPGFREFFLEIYGDAIRKK